jgi:uncharacterized protein (DUF2147 family)
MRSIVPYLLAAMLAGMAPAASQAQDKPPEDDLIGDWVLPENENGYVIHTYRCGDAFCGQIVKAADPTRRDVYNPDIQLRRRPILGIVIATDFYKKGPAWQGAFYNPRNGFTYKGSLKLTDRNRLIFAGCLFSFLFCDTKVFYRVDPPPSPKPQKPSRRTASRDRPPVPAAKAKPAEKEPTRADFEAFLKERDTTNAPAPGNQESKALFDEFLAWRNTQRAP